MTKKLYIAILVVTFAFIYTGASYTAEEQPGTMEEQPSAMEEQPSTTEEQPGAAPLAPKKKARQKSTRIYGTVKEMVDNTLKLTLEKGETTTTSEEVSIVLNDKTKVISGRERKTSADIQAGQNVMVWYRENAGEKVASSVRILKPKKMKSKTMQEPAP